MVRISGLNSSEVKVSNRSQILHMVHMEPCSRAELSRRMGLTRASVSIIINQLLEDGIVREGAYQETRGGRPSVAIELNPDAAYALGISLRRNAMKMGVMNLQGKVSGYRSFQIEAMPHDRDGVMEFMKDSVREIMRDTKLPGEFLGIGISSPGPLDSESGRILNPPNFSRFQDVAIVDLLKKEFGCEVLLENDVIALALAENVYGIRGKYDSFLEIVADCGLGSGLVFQGKRFGDMNGFGHISVDIHGPQCMCGNRGCVELFASIENIVEYARRMDIRLDSWEKITDMAAIGDPLALKVLDEEGEYLAEAIVSAANVISFDAVVLAGSLAYRSEMLSGRMMDIISRRIFKKRKIEVLPSVLEENANVSSGAELLINKWLKE